MSRLWDTFEAELIVSVQRCPTEYALEPGESAESYAQRVRQRMQRVGVQRVNYRTPTWRRVARRLGVQLNYRSLIEAERQP